MRVNIEGKDWIRHYTECFCGYPIIWWEDEKGNMMCNENGFIAIYHECPRCGRKITFEDRK
jgi:hypothetical protein